jgi:hypothetical protein
MKYDTNNLDEAAYLALQGCHFTVTRTGQFSALFSFENDEHFNEVRAKFWKGEVTVQLHRWLATRAALKTSARVRRFRQSVFLRRHSYPRSLRQRLS